MSKCGRRIVTRETSQSDAGLPYDDSRENVMNERVTRGTPPPPALEEFLHTRVEWRPTGDVMEPWRSQLGRNLWSLRLNDFPEEHLYTLLINGRSAGSFDDWPAEWLKIDSAELLPNAG